MSRGKHGRVIVSPVGISTFFNSLTREEREANLGKELNRNSNANQLPDEFAGKVEELRYRIQDRLAQGSVQDRRGLSAELNGLYGIYDEQIDDSNRKNDIHMLIATDTCLGRLAAKNIYHFLRNELGFVNVQIIRPHNLNTASVTEFAAGIKDLLNQFEQQLPGYNESGYEIIFNLTGSFKSLQGYLSIIGMFYADRLVYIFESGQELLQIPRLPLKIDDDSLAEHAIELARLAVGGILPRNELHLPGALLDVDKHGYATLSDWGQLIWNRIKKRLLTQKLLDFPHLEYEKSFRKEFCKAPPEDKIQLQETLAKVSNLLVDNQGDVSKLKSDGGLQYDNYSGLSSSTPIGHFRIDGGKRVTCIAVNGKLYLRHFGSHDYTERVEGIS